MCIRDSNEADASAKKYNQSLQEQIKLDGISEEQKKANAETEKELEKDKEKAASDAKKAIEDEARLLESNQNKINNFADKQTDLGIDMKRDLIEINALYAEQLAIAEEIRNSDLRAKKIEEIQADKLKSLQGLSQSFAYRFSDLGLNLSRENLNIAGTASNIDDTMLMNLTTALNNMTLKLSELSVNVDVNELSSKLTKNLSQYEILNDLGRI